MINTTIISALTIINIIYTDAVSWYNRTYTENVYRHFFRS